MSKTIRSFMNKTKWLTVFRTHGDNVTNTTKFKWSSMGKLRKVKIHHFFSNRMSIRNFSMIFNHKKTNLSELIKKVRGRRDYKEFGLPLPINSVCKLMGVFNGSVPKRTDNKNYYQCPLVYDVFSKDYDIGGMLANQIKPGSYDYAHYNLELMADDSRTGYTIDEMIDGIISRIGIDLRLPFIKFWSPDVIKGLLTNPKAYSGLLTSRLVSQKRRQSTGYVKEYCMEYIRKIIFSSRPIIDDSFVAVGGREKLIVPSETYKILKTRIILMMEDVPTIIGQSIAVPITKSLQRLNTGFSFIGRSLEERNFDHIVREGEGDLIETITCGADFSGHDNEVKEKQMVLAFGLLRLCFPQWRFMDKLFYYCLSSMVNKNIVLPDSNLVYKITKGIATGHPFTSLVNTICAYTIFATAFNKICTPEELKVTRIWAAGDDIICKVPLNKLKLISEELINNSGMKLNSLSDESGPMISNNPKYTIAFLKKKFTHLGPAWNDYELISNLANNANGITKSYDEIERINMMLMNGPCDFELNERVLNLIKMHFKRPRYSLYDTISVRDFDLKNDNLHRLDQFIHNRYDKRTVFPPMMQKAIIRNFRNNIRLTFGWFNIAKPFAGLGKKDESYWIDAGKVHDPPIKMRFKGMFNKLIKRIYNY